MTAQNIKTESEKVGPHPAIIHPSKLLPKHQQKFQNSCIAWGLELVLKMHNAIPEDDYPLQNGSDPCGYGFDRDLLKKHGIASQEHHFDWPEFCKFSFEQVTDGSYPIFTLPLQLSVDLEQIEILTGFHAFVCCDNEGQLVALTMELSRLIKIDYLAKLFEACRQVVPQCKFHVLEHWSQTGQPTNAPREDHTKPLGDSAEGSRQK